MTGVRDDGGVYSWSKRGNGDSGAPLITRKGGEYKHAPLEWMEHLCGSGARDWAAIT